MWWRWAQLACFLFGFAGTLGSTREEEGEKLLCMQHRAGLHWLARPPATAERSHHHPATFLLLSLHLCPPACLPTCPPARHCRCCTVLTWTAARWGRASRGRRHWAPGALWGCSPDSGRHPRAPRGRGSTRPSHHVVPSTRLPACLIACLLTSPPPCPPVWLCSDSPLAKDPWNLSVLPRQAGRHSSLLRVLDGHIAGEPACNRRHAAFYFITTASSCPSSLERPSPPPCSWQPCCAWVARAGCAPARPTLRHPPARPPCPPHPSPPIPPPPAPAAERRRDGALGVCGHVLQQLLLACGGPHVLLHQLQPLGGRQAVVRVGWGGQPRRGLVVGVVGSLQPLEGGHAAAVGLGWGGQKWGLGEVGDVNTSPGHWTCGGDSRCWLAFPGQAPHMLRSRSGLPLTAAARACPPCRYGVPAWAASRFEAVFRAELADQIEAQVGVGGRREGGMLPLLAASRRPVNVDILPPSLAGHAPNQPSPSHAYTTLNLPFVPSPSTIFHPATPPPPPPTHPPPRSPTCCSSCCPCCRRGRCSGRASPSTRPSRRRGSLWSPSQTPTTEASGGALRLCACVMCAVCGLGWEVGWRGAGVRCMAVRAACGRLCALPPYRAHTGTHITPRHAEPCRLCLPCAAAWA